ncbi:UbiA-like polyprenyltransferase [Blastopirellula marina]|uniref:4-hydroxybenzoate polyprenyltransferase n=1 Tax=Blastopirellula marina DSM 3645 TaxID=314230 RepID=A3ZUF4_9BACT|nr:UbiA-like polyprenyltransferase [Blastopirellula marina]EAQ79864.1 4-hydroxybenzoate octaprenyltransferase [Blastopirellula marina DSM 3645]
MIQRISDILAMIRFSHTVFAMPFALLAAVMAWTAPAPPGVDIRFSWRELLGIVLCMVFARSAAMALNRLADRQIDAENPRTQSRHIPAGVLSVGEVTLFTIACSIGFVASTLLFWPNWLPLALSIPVLLFLFGYSYTKRWTALAHFWLGASLMLAPIAAWIAIRGAAILVDPLDLLPAVTLGAAVLLWVAGFDIIYACQDAQFDRAAKLHSVPSTFGVAGALRIAAVCHALMIGALTLLPVVYPSLGLIYWLGVAAVASLLIYEHAIVRPDDLSRVNLAFFHVNTIVGVGLFVVTTIDLLLW